jgi:molybdate transport system substrate-binding protein
VSVVTFRGGRAASIARCYHGRRIQVLTISLVAAAALALGAAGAASPEPRHPALTIFAAADLAFALKEIAARFEQTHDTKVTLVLGSTGHLAQQVAHGAPADVLFAANERFVDDLVRRGAIIPGTRALYAQGRIALATRKDRGPRLTELTQLADPRVRRIAIANPQHAPYGKAAEEALRAAGVWGAVVSTLVFGENIRHALQFLETGAVDAAIIALSLASVPGIEHALIDAALHEPLNQVVGVVTRSCCPERALAFIQYVNGPHGRPIMKRYGFRLPGEV